MDNTQSVRIITVGPVAPIGIAPFDVQYSGPPTSLIESAGQMQTGEGGGISLRVQLPGRANFPPGSLAVKVTVEQNPEMVPVTEDPTQFTVVAVPEGGGHRYFLLCEFGGSESARPESRESATTPGQMLPLPRWVSDLHIPHIVKINPEGSNEREVELCWGGGQIIRMTLVQETTPLPRSPEVERLTATIRASAPSGPVFSLFDIGNRMEGVRAALERHSSQPRSSTVSVIRALLRHETIGGTAVRHIQLTRHGKGGRFVGSQSYDELCINPGATFFEQPDGTQIIITSDDEILLNSPLSNTPGLALSGGDPERAVTLYTPYWLGYQALADAVRKG